MKRNVCLHLRHNFSFNSFTSNACLAFMISKVPEYIHMLYVNTGPTTLNCTIQLYFELYLDFDFKYKSLNILVFFQRDNILSAFFLVDKSLYFSRSSVQVSSCSKKERSVQQRLYWMTMQHCTSCQILTPDTAVEILPQHIKQSHH